VVCEVVGLVVCQGFPDSHPVPEQKRRTCLHLPVSVEGFVRNDSLLEARTIQQAGDQGLHHPRREYNRERGVLESWGHRCPSGSQRWLEINGRLKGRKTVGGEYDTPPPFLFGKKRDIIIMLLWN